MCSKGSVIDGIKNGDVFSGVFHVRSCARSTSRVRRDYWKMIIEDATGKIEAYFWEPLAEAIKPNSVVWASGKGRTLGARTICDILSVISISQEGICPLLIAPPDVPLPNESIRVAELLSTISDINLAKLTHRILSNRLFLRALLLAPGSLRHHHAYPGGLIRHTRETMEIVLANADMLCPTEKDTLLTCAFLHDLGKAYEYTNTRRLTDRGEMLGHEVTLLEMLTPIIDELWELNHPHRVALLHLLVAKPAPQWTGIRHPRTSLSKILRFADNLSSEMAMAENNAGAKRFKRMMNISQNVTNSKNIPTSEVIAKLFIRVELPLFKA